MDPGHSISFASFDSYNYPGPNNLTFHEVDPSGFQDGLANDSMIRRFPGKKVDFRGNLQVLILLQTAEIERLTTILHDYRNKLKRILNNEKDYNSFKNQADELLHAKDELELRNKRINQYAETQKGELLDQQRYVQGLESKYKRALKLIEQAHLARQQAQILVHQQREDISTIERTFELFKQRSVEEYQLLREELEKSKNEDLAIQLSKFNAQKQRLNQALSRQENRRNTEKQKLQAILQQQKSRNAATNSQLIRLRQQMSQSQQRLENLARGSLQTEKQREEQINLLGNQIQRLSLLLKERSQKGRLLENQIKEAHIKLNQKVGQIQLLKRQTQRYRNKASLYEQELSKQNSQITKLSGSVSTLNNRINQLGLLVEEKDVQLKVKDSKMAKQIENYSQVLSKSEFTFNKQIQQYKVIQQTLGKQLQKLKRDSYAKQQGYLKKISNLETKIENLEIQKQQTKLKISLQVQQKQQFKEKAQIQIGSYTKEIDLLKRKVAQIQKQKKKLEENFRRQQKQLINKSKELYDQKWEQINKKYFASNEKIKDLIDNKQVLQKTIINLQFALDKCQIEKREPKASRNFESMIKQIEDLCKSTLQKDDQILGLKAVISNTQLQVIQLKKQIESLREVTMKLINMTNANESGRRQDNYLLIQEIKKLFLSQSLSVQQIKQNTNRIAFNYNRHKQFLQQSQIHIVKSKQIQIAQLKQKLSFAQRQSQSKTQLKEIINKIVVITKQNTQLKVRSSKQQLQTENLIRQLENLKKEASRGQDSARANIKDKDEICKKLYSQLEDSNQLLIEERQNQMRLQSALINLEQQKERNLRQIEKKESLIKQLKILVKNKEDQFKESRQMLENLQSVYQNLKQQSQLLKENKQNLQIMLIQKEQQFQIMREKQQNQQNSFRRKEGEYEKNRQLAMTAISQTNQQSNFQISKLKSQINLLISQNQELKSQIIKTGGTIFQLSEENMNLKRYEINFRQITQQCQHFKQEINDLLEKIQQKQAICYQLNNLQMEFTFSQNQIKKNQKMISEFAEKENFLNRRVQILQKQINKLELIIGDLKSQNNLLSSKNYEQSLIIEKNKIVQQKIIVLSQQIDRLQLQRINLIEELNYCKIEISQQSVLDRQVKNYHLTLVLLFVEVQSLRQQLSRKEQELNQLRRLTLK